MNEILFQCSILITVFGLSMLYIEWRIRNYNTIVAKKIDAVMAKLLTIKFR
jgi:hypothetical protein